MWNRRRLFQEVGEGKDAVRWCQDNGLLPRALRCRRCHHQMSFTRGTTGLGKFRCRKAQCNVSVALTKNTWFEKSKLKPEQVLGICYSFTTDAGYELARREAFDGATGTHLSSETIGDWYNYCREIITDDFTLLQEQTGQIGGPGRIVQIDESKFGRRKYHCGRRAEGHWVLGLIEYDSEDFRMVLCPDNRRGAEDLIPIIQQHVAAGTEIHTDGWRSYRDLMDCGMGYDHRIVNHADPEHRFVSAEGVHTRIESCWRPAKAWFATKRFRNGAFADHLVEWLWRRDLRKRDADLFEELLSAVRRQYLQ